MEGVFCLKWAFADFEDEYVALDLPHIPEPTRSEMTKELELRFFSRSHPALSPQRSQDALSLGPSGLPVRIYS